MVQVAVADRSSSAPPVPPPLATARHYLNRDDQLVGHRSGGRMAIPSATPRGPIRRRLPVIRSTNADDAVGIGAIQVRTWQAPAASS
jgi:hypothetical protein